MLALYSIGNIYMKNYNIERVNYILIREYRLLFRSMTLLKLTVCK